MLVTNTTETTIIEAAIRSFLRYGARKTSMNDIAMAANVSRQTLYDLFGSKDDLIRASIRSITDKSIADIRVKASSVKTLSEQLGVYFEENVIKSFEMMLVSDDPQDLVTGHNEAGKAEIALSRLKHEALLSEWLSPHAAALSDSGHSVQGFAHFIVTVSMAFKYEATDRADLDELLRTLQAITLIATRQNNG